MLPGDATAAMASLLNPKAVAVVGASQRAGRGSAVIANLRDAGFKGGIIAVNPRYTDVLGYPCVPSVSDLPAAVDCIVLAVAADVTLDVLEQAYARGIRAAVVLAAGFGEGGQHAARTAHLRALTQRGMCICGPNCFGFFNVKSGVAAFSGIMPKTLRRGPVALVSQSGSLGNFVFGPLMRDRGLGFSYFVSCGNQLGATVEDYVEFFVADDDVKLVAAVIEDLKNPQKLRQVAAAARRLGKPLIFFQAGRSARGQVMIGSHTGALAGNSELLAAFLRHCGIIQPHGYDEFVETVELLAHVRPAQGARALVVVSGSGGGAAVAADQLDAHGVALAELSAATQERIRAVLPAFGSVTNPIDATGAAYDDPALMPKLFDAILSDPSQPTIAASVIAAPSDKMRRIAGAIADAARASGRPIVAYNPTPLGTPDREIVDTLSAAGVPLLMGIGGAMSALKHLSHPHGAMNGDTPALPNAAPASETTTAPLPSDFLGARAALMEHGVTVADGARAATVDEAIALQRRFGAPVALKAEAAGLLHKSDIGCVRLGCATRDEVADAYEAIVANARKAGFADIDVLVQPMVAGVAEAFAGVIDDALYGPAIVFGIGGIFVEILRDTTTEMAPLSHEAALRMIHGMEAAAILTGARGRERADIDALATLLVSLGRFALANRGRFRALDLNPIMVGREGAGAIAVDIAVEPLAPPQLGADA
jgi:acetyltransferase